MEVLTLFLAGAAGAAIVKMIDNIIQWLLGRKAKKEDTKIITLGEMGKKIETIERGQRVILHDRIKYLARCYVEKREVDYDDYRDLVEMHNTYAELGGENLKRPMEDVSKLKMIYK
ncbi:MAG: hypothetical protein PHO41_07595 [Eubacteriales bacterium]|nr:hypothetical protein [Eubacteriales bacterium]